jgi:hypothetical protein
MHKLVIITLVINFELYSDNMKEVFSNQQMHTLKLFCSFISITEFPYICFGP